MANIHTVVNAQALKELLVKAKYNTNEVKFLYKGFTEGFDIGYRGPIHRRSESKNILFTVGDKFKMWEKIMKEIAAGRVAGPYDTIPFNDYIQSPIGLVPKSGNKTRLIFHLSYNFSDQEIDFSLNHFTPEELCSVKYNDLDHAVLSCLEMSRIASLETGNSTVFLAKSDLMSAFRMLPIKSSQWKWIIFKAVDPETGIYRFLVEKNLPFGVSVSCSLFQRFSNCLRHLLNFLTGRTYSVTNYLDDYLFIEVTRERCNKMVTTFLNLCNQISLPVALEKTEWATNRIVFLGILLDGRTLTLSIPVD